MSLHLCHFDKEASQNLDPERMTIADRQGMSEDLRFEIKPTQSKPDSSSCFGIPCVFLHGFLGGKEDWTEIGDILSEKFFCIAFDLQSTPKLSFEIEDDHCDILSYS